jgi:hypothetical protein
LNRIAAVHWFTEERIVFAETVVTKKRHDRRKNIMKFREVEVMVAIELKPDLPAGPISRNMNMERILEVIAESFGLPVTTHPAGTASTLYSGPWDGQTIATGILAPKGDMLVTGTFSPDCNRCHLVWAFDLEKYREWFVDG